eukprot:4705529-Prymnesium_polylepis.1
MSPSSLAAPLAGSSRKSAPSRVPSSASNGSGLTRNTCTLGMPRNDEAGAEVETEAAAGAATEAAADTEAAAGAAADAEAAAGAGAAVCDNEDDEAAGAGTAGAPRSAALKARLTRSTDRLRASSVASRCASGIAASCSSDLAEVHELALLFAEGGSAQ